jgi:hypothetical protein
MQGDHDLAARGRFGSLRARLGRDIPFFPIFGSRQVDDKVDFDSAYVFVIGSLGHQSLPGSVS